MITPGLGSPVCFRFDCGKKQVLQEGVVSVDVRDPENTLLREFLIAESLSILTVE